MGFLKVPFVVKYQKNEGDPLETMKNFRETKNENFEKSLIVPKIFQKKRPFGLYETSFCYQNIKKFEGETLWRQKNRKKTYSAELKLSTRKGGVL